MEAPIKLWVELRDYELRITRLGSFKSFIVRKATECTMMIDTSFELSRCLEHGYLDMDTLKFDLYVYKSSRTSEIVNLVKFY